MNMKENKILSNKKARKKLYKGVKLLVDTVSSTLGPKGSNVILQDEFGSTFITKDGISVAKKVYSNDKYEDAAIQIVRQASMKTAEMAGDGTTTTLVLVKALLDNIKNYNNFNRVKEGVYDALDCATEYIQDQSKEVKYDYDNLYGIAYTSTNNDSEIADMVTKAFVSAGENGMVTISNEFTTYTYVEESKGTMLDRGYLDKIYINNHERGVATYKNPKLILVNGSLDNLKEIVPVINSSLYKLSDDRGIVIIAHEFSNATKNALFQNHYQGIRKFLPIEAEGFGVNKRDCIEDLIAITQAEKFNDKIYISDNVEEIVSNVNSTYIITEGDNSKHLEDRISYLKSVAEDAKDDSTKQHYLKKIAKLVGKLYTIHVGGSTEVEAKELYDRIEDAVCAVKAALTCGISDGGGITFLNTSVVVEDFYRYKNRDYKIGYLAVVKALKEPLKTLCRNSQVSYKKVMDSILPWKGIGYDFSRDKTVDMKEAHIQDPTEVLINAIENAVSVVMTLLSTKNIILNNE